MDPTRKLIKPLERHYEERLYSREYFHLMRPLPLDVINILQEYKTTPAKLDRYATLLRDKAKALPFLKHHSLDKLSRIGITALLEKKLTFNEVVTLHQYIGVYETLFVNPITFTRIVEPQGKTHDIETIIPHNWTNPDIRIYKYDEGLLNLKTYFHFHENEVALFSHSISKETPSEQFFKIFRLPPAGSFSPLYERILTLIPYFHPFISESTGFKWLIVPSFTMYQLFFDIKAQALGKKSIKLVPTFGEINGDDCLALKKKWEVPFIIYCPVPRYTGNKYTLKEKKQALNVSSDRTKTYKSFSGIYPSNPLIVSIDHLYRAVRENVLTEECHALRLRLIELIDEFSFKHKEVADDFQNIRNLLIDGELIQPLQKDNLDTRPLLEQILTNKALPWPICIKDYVQKMLVPGYVPLSEQIKRRESIAFKQEDFRLHLEAISPAYRPFAAVQYVIKNGYEPLVYAVSRKIAGKPSISESECRTSCVESTYLLALMFLGPKLATSVTDHFRKERSMEFAITLKSGKEWNYELNGLLDSPASVYCATKNFPVTTEEFSKCPTALEFNQYVNTKVIPKAIEEATIEESERTEIKIIEKRLRTIDFNFNKPVFDALKAEIKKNAFLTTAENSHVYFLGIAKPKHNYDGSHKPYETNFFHALTIEQYLSKKRKVRYRDYQSWNGHMTLNEYLTQRKARLKDKGSREDIMPFINDIATYLDPATPDREGLGPFRKSVFGCDTGVDYPPIFYDSVNKVLKGLSLRYVSHSFDPKAVFVNTLSVLKI